MARRQGRLESSNLIFAPVTVPTAVIMDFAGVSAPAGWLLCAGQAVSRITYATLFSYIGTTYGVGDGSTTFNLPDSRGRVHAGKDDMGGTPANRLTTAGSGIGGTGLGNSGGSEVHTLNANQLPTHNHAVAIYGGEGDSVGVAPAASAQAIANSTNSQNLGIWKNAKSGGNLAVIQNAGGGLAHENTQPTIVFNKIIKI